MSVLFLIQLPVLAYSLDELHNHPTWQLLLQHNGQDFLINDPDFYLTSQDAKAELLGAITLFFSNHTISAEQTSGICRFPARYEWLRSMLDLLDWPTAQSLCPDFAEFLHRVPLENVYLVYAAENITQPSSMMGHSFLALKGTTDDGRELAHALTFFTDVDLMRPVDLIWGSLVTGKLGHLVISPLRDQMAFYLHDEQRNVYEYPVTMSLAQQELLQAHLWELRQVKMDYFFHTFNCATLTNNLLGFSSVELTQYSTNWLSPLDVVKLSSRQGILGAPVLYPSDKWKVREVGKVLRSNGLLADFNQMYQNMDLLDMTDPTKNLLLTELADGLAHFQYSQGELTESQFNNKQQLFASITTDNSQHQLQLPASRDPLLRANDSQFGISWDSDNRLALRWLPAAHLVSDNHRHAFSESELQLFSLTASYQPATQSLRLEDATLYAVSSFLPYDSLTGGLSGRFHMRAYRQQKSADLKVLTPSIGGGLGASFSLHQDLMFYALMNASVEQHQGVHLTVGPEVGLIMYQLFNNKSLVSFQQDINYLGTGKSSQRLSWQQSWFVHPKFTLFWGFEKQWYQRQRYFTTEFELRMYY